jgi:hypothetical protein
LTAPAPAASSGRPVRLLGCLLAVLVTDPTVWASRPPVLQLLPVAAFVGAFWAAAPLTARPVLQGFRWYRRLARHRNTAFAVCCVALATLHQPPPWLAACDAALLLTYLVCVDAAAAGPPGARLLRRPPALLAAYGATALVFAAAVLPVSTAGTWGRVVAALAVAAASTALAVALRAGPRR